MIERREILKGIGIAATAAATVSAATEAARAQTNMPLDAFGAPWDPVDPDFPGRQNIVRVPDDFFIPDRFAGKTVLVTGCARGMGQMAAIRLAREGANIVGVDWLEAEGRAVIDGITAAGGKAT